ncbi:MraY family glycosyltransferase [Coraliomargarita sp. SDUM461004]|uniref:MraY family glycosyltransferase n=1 Tax=Thalassobacterium sedimentorum TaxID=3041258 RepID=A0ABU1AKF0_9BACT|nr:MraY family glycosyltransferase [Coraliomargarita sp. SDUM461004]MDQ8195224.1 MraY family glycosyltransferase [Coraliomargarita sp. SDUM461004]
MIPRIGGLGIICGFAVTYLLCFLHLDSQDNQSLIHYGIFLGASASFLLGFVDDFHPLGAKVKLLAQVIIAMLAHECGLSIEKMTIPFTDVTVSLGVFSLALTVIWVVSVMNLINLIDGLDGLAGGIGLMLMALLAFLAYEAGVAISLILALGMIGSIMGFLFHNFPPAKVYMGDSGAYLIGYVIASLSLLNSEKGTVLAALIAPVLALALPIADVAYAMLRRSIKGLPIFRPDQGHIHHRLIRSGLSRQKTVLFLYAISLFALIGGLLAFAYQGRYLPIFLGFAFVLILFALRGQKISPMVVREVLTESFQSRQDARNALYLRDWFIVEAERADTGQHLWTDYRFILKKMGVCRAELIVRGAERTFFQPDTPHNQIAMLWSEEHQIGEDVTLCLYAAKDNFSQRQFAIISDIAAEAWSKASMRWQVVNGVALDFDAKASDSSNYRDQKAKNLYRPTY